MPDTVSVRRPGPLDAVVVVPGSKSLTNRALPLAAMAGGISTLHGCLEAEDTDLMLGALQALGLSLRRSGATIRITGRGGPLARTSPPDPLQVGTAGTVARFLTAILSAGPAPVALDGSPRMRERPMGTLLDALGEQGASFLHDGLPGALPFRIQPPSGGLPGGQIHLQELASSQFVSALLLASPLMTHPLTLVLEQGTPARPYVDMTVAVLRAFGSDARWTDTHTLAASPGRLEATSFQVEPDASGASYFLAAAAIYGGRVRIEHLGSSSLQGDAGFARVLEQMGAEVEQGPTHTAVTGRGGLRGIDVDLSAMPDMTLTLAVAALHAEGPTRIRGVEILRHHESDRLHAAAAELRKLGATVEEEDDGLTIHPPERPGRDVVVDTYLDHRMAMAFALAGDVQIRDPGCVAKTYPGYFKELHKLGMVQVPP